MGGKTFSVVFGSDVFKVKDIVGEALDFLTGSFSCLSEDSLFETKLIISEALLNAVTHGNGENASKKVLCEISVNDDCSILICITDEGGGFDYGTILNEEISPGSLSREYGRGIRLVYSLSDRVSYNKKGNRIEIYKKVVSDG